MTSFSWDLFQSLPVVGVLRGFERRLAPGIIRCCLAGGLTNLEVTMNSPGAADQIRQMIDLAGSRLNVGAGTVLNLELLRAALAAGASFIVTPNLRDDLVQSCVERQVPVFPGVMTLTELARARDLGTRWVKVFPADAVSLDYLRSAQEIFPDVHLLATGGVTLESLPSLITAGAAGCGIGSPLFEPSRVRAEDWGWLEQRCRAFVQAWVHHCRSG
jgi:2-dehydro-3-deoxyphosphogluconate aldolase/(4S)-4-hydroxy-2-oxoglutarate aldolase